MRRRWEGKKDKDKIETALKLYDTKQFTVKDVLKISGISSSVSVKPSPHFNQSYSMR